MTPGQGSAPQRILLGIAGIIALLIGALLSLGSAFAGAIGVWLASLVARARGRPLTRVGAWIGAASSVTIYMLVGGFLVYRALGPDGIAQVRAVADSASAANRDQPPPAWLERLSPDAARQMTDTTRTAGAGERLVAVYGGLVGVGFVLGLFATAGWGAALLLAFALTGRWIGAPLARDAAP